MIKVYQEEMQNLVSAVAALNGLRARLIPEEEERSKIDESLLPFITTPAVQMLSYALAVLKGTDVDKPRNLAKSVTVE